MSAGWAPWLAAPLRRTLESPAHALLLHGPGALGQLDLGLAAARAMLCESPAPGGLACGACPSCHLFDQRSHPDFLLLMPDALRERIGWLDAPEGEAKTKPSRDIKVDTVRAAIAWSQQSTSRGGADRKSVV